MNLVFNKSEVLEVDIHKMNVWQAQTYLERLIESLQGEIKEVVVIHGYNGGIALQTMVRKELRSQRIMRRFLWLNQGRTSLILN